jgi:magnesium chelatase family protein
LDEQVLEDTLFVGELGLNGEVKKVKGILPMMLMAKEQGVKRCFLPRENAEEGSVVQGIQVFAVDNLKEIVEYLHSSGEEPVLRELSGMDVDALFAGEDEEDKPDFADIRGQEMVKRAAVIAAAGFHHLLITGTPGAGKTMIAKRIPSILPPLSLEESLEVSRIYSVSGLLKQGKPLITSRPFYHPHHTISPQALAGGGRIPRPGILSLSHRGVLFLDELPEFGRENIEVLRQPLEDKEVQVARSYGCITYPANVMLVAAMNPCPCGFYPDRNRCRCTPAEIKRYRSRISGPIYDRIDLSVEARTIALEELQGKAQGETSESMRKQVMTARSIQEARYRGCDIVFNADLEARDMESYCRLGKEERTYMEEMFTAMGLSARGYHKILKVARTIADLEESESIRVKHLGEAICFHSSEL